MVGRKNRKKLSFAENPHFVHLMIVPHQVIKRWGEIDNPDFLCPTLEVASVCCTGVIATGRTISRSLGAGRVRVGTPNLIMEIDPNFNQRIRSRSTLSSWSLEKFSHGRLKIENVENKQRKRKCTRLCGRKEYGGGGLTIINVRRVWHICIMQFSITNAKA